ncbi:hypothetical protein LCGC14_1697380 [marine sediment metagenome]|uniref:Uncharacterized protein n=1 Tax=marine sediment metagenome TaxID=412755 RepID=A0A0F9I6M4_9ZZZZ
MPKNTDLYIIASALQQSYIDEYDEEMIDNIFAELQGRRNNGEFRTLQTPSISC